jgi:hypothetical protein
MNGVAKNPFLRHIIGQSCGPRGSKRQFLDIACPALPIGEIGKLVATQGGKKVKNDVFSLKSYWRVPLEAPIARPVAKA